MSVSRRLANVQREFITMHREIRMQDMEGEKKKPVLCGSLSYNLSRTCGALDGRPWKVVLAVFQGVL